MPTLQPTKSDMWVRSAATTESAFQLWHLWITTVSVHWEVVSAFGTSGGDGFIVRQLAGDTTSKYLLRRNVNTLEMLIDPLGTVTLLDGSDASAMALPLRSILTVGTGSDRNEWQLHEWDDYFSLYAVDRSSSICDMPVCAKWGYVISPGLASDPADGLTGQGVLGGVTNNTNNSGNFFTSSSSSPSIIRVAANGDVNDWAEIYGSISASLNVPFGAVTNSNLISDRNQPSVGTAVIKSPHRNVGLYKYLFAYGATGQTPGNVLISGGVSKFQYIGHVNSSSYLWVVPIQNNFDPAAGPKNI